MPNRPRGRPGESSGADASVTEQVTQGAQAATQQAQQAAGDLTDQARQQTTSLLQRQKGTAAQTLNSVALAIRQTGQNLEQQDQGNIGQYAYRAADQIERVSGYLEARDIQDLVGEAESLARRSPALFLGGAFTLGVLAARFLKSSSPDGSRGQMGYAGRSGTYNYDNVTYATEDVQGAPQVERGYAPGLMGRDPNVRTGDGS